MKSEMKNAFSVDVEDYFQVSAFEDVIKREDWGRHKIRVAGNTGQLLEMLADHGVKATFFILGWVAKKAPELVRMIADQGHEVASHGMEHTRVTRLSPQAFARDVAESKEILEQLSGTAVSGYRAPSYSINESNFWAFDALEQAGYRYSSSVYPVKHDLYGVPDAPRRPFLAADTRIVEIPVSTTRIFGRNLPAGGGGYFRFFPYFLSRWAIRRINSEDQQPVIFYCHPWEVDPDQPRVAGARIKSRVRHYLNLKRTAPRLSRLFEDFEWAPVASVYEEQINSRTLPRWQPQAETPIEMIHHGGT